MIVVDASALVEYLLGMPSADAVEARLFATGEPLHAPHLIDPEVAQVARRYAKAGHIDAVRGEMAMIDLAALRLHRHRQDDFLPRIWQLRHNLTAYDAAYVALAELLDAPLVTRDARLARASGHDARVDLV